MKSEETFLFTFMQQNSDTLHRVGALYFCWIAYQLIIKKVSAHIIVKRTLNYP